ESARTLGIAQAEDHRPDDLRDERDDGADREDRLQHVLEGDETEDRGHASQEQQRDNRVRLGGVQLREEREEVPVARRGVEDAGVAEEEREDRGEGGPEDEDRDPLRGALAEEE